MTDSIQLKCLYPTLTSAVPGGSSDLWGGWGARSSIGKPGTTQSSWI